MSADSLARNSRLRDYTSTPTRGPAGARRQYARLGAPVSTESNALDERFDPFGDVMAFHRKFGVRVGHRPGLPSHETVALRLRLIAEETDELRDAVNQQDLVATADAIADLLYVVYGTAVSFGIDIRPVFAEVHRTNMAKAGGSTRADGKVLKPKGWTPPEIAPLLAEMRLRESEDDD